MEETVLQQVLDEFLPSLEALEAQNAAILQLLKDKKLASDEELAAHLAHAENASSVRWRAARARLNYLLTAVTKAPEPVSEKLPEPGAGKSTKEPPEKEDTKTQDNQKQADDRRNDERKTNVSAKLDQNVAASTEKGDLGVKDDDNKVGRDKKSGEVTESQKGTTA